MEVIITEQEAKIWAEKFKGHVWHVKKLGWVFTFIDEQGHFIVVSSKKQKWFRSCNNFLEAYPKSVLEHYYSDKPPIAYQQNFFDLGEL